MTNRNRRLVLRLEGALQSWGEDAKWDYRDTASMPSKSGIVGLLACAMGLERNSPEIARLSAALTVAVRADRPGERVVDFHTVTGDPLMNAEGKRRSLGDTIITRHVYLQDASFLVALETDEAWYQRILAGLNAPKWCIYLGRKNCIPSRPVLEDPQPAYGSLLELIQKYPACSRPKYPMSYECEQPEDTVASYLRPDERLAGYRSFALRRVWRGVVKEDGYVSDQN